MVTHKQMQKWADDGGAVHHVNQPPRRGRGRPARGSEPMHNVAVRLTREELAALDAAAAQQRLSRSEIIRVALTQYTA